MSPVTNWRGKQQIYAALVWNFWRWAIVLRLYLSALSIISKWLIPQYTTMHTPWKNKPILYKHLFSRNTFIPKTSPVRCERSCVCCCCCCRRWWYLLFCLLVLKYYPNRVISKERRPHLKAQRCSFENRKNCITFNRKSPPSNHL